MKLIVITAVVLCCFSTLFAQSDLKKLVDTEHAFAARAASANTRDAFLEFMADDGVVFTPEKTLAKPFWQARKPNASLLSWAPNFADISSNGMLGYTTGNWEWRAKGKDDAPSAFGDFITLWLRQPDGKYKWVVDIGVEHPKPAKYSTEWSTAAAGKSLKGVHENESTVDFYKLASEKGLAKAYGEFADSSLRSYRETKAPIIGKKNALIDAKSEKATLTFAKQSQAFRSTDISYALTPYSKTVNGKVEKGNYLQIWKFDSGKWHLVLDIFKPLEP